RRGARGGTDVPGRPVQPAPGGQQEGAAAPALVPARAARGVRRGAGRADHAHRQARPPAGRAGQDQVQGGDRGHAQRRPAQPGARLRGGDGPLLRPDRAGARPGGALPGREDRADAPHEEPLHHPRRPGLRRRLQRQLPARVRPVLAGDLAGEGRGRYVNGVGEVGRKAGRGLRWTLVGNVVMKAGSFAMSLVLARLLTNDDFGVFAIALAASQFVIYVNDAGVIAATVQWRGRLEEIAPTATVVAIASSLTLYGLLWVIAPFYASFAGNEDATWVIRILMATNVVYGLTAVRSAALMRRFEQDKLAWANLAGFCANAAVAITLAAGGAGAYSFAWGQLSGAALTGVL